MRTILAALALMLVLSLPVSAQTLMVESAEYKVGMSLEEAIRTAKMWDQELFWQEANGAYDVISNSSNSKESGRFYKGQIEVSAGKISGIEVLSGKMNFIEGYRYFKYMENELGQKWGAPRAIDLGEVHEYLEDGNSVSITTEAPSWSVMLLIIQRPNEPLGCTVFTRVFKKKKK